MLNTDRHCKIINRAKRKAGQHLFARIWMSGDVAQLTDKPVAEMTSRERTQLKYSKNVLRRRKA